MKLTNNKVLSAVALLSCYNWFNVTAENAKDGKPYSFCSTGIDIDKYGYMTFDRQFAIPHYSHGAAVDATATNERKFTFLTDQGDIYTIEASNKALADPNTASGSADDPASLIDWSRTYIDETGDTFVVLDLRKMGIISSALYRRIQHYMNVYQGGYSNLYQVCRTIYFCKEGEKIYFGLYDLETEQPITKLSYYTEEDYFYDDEILTKIRKVRRMMKEARDRLST